MASPTFYFDGVFRRIYEVPPGASYVLNGNYRVYDGGTFSYPVMEVDVKKDLWSRWVDWHSLHDWALFAFSRSGGSLRPTGEYAPADFSLLTSLGWRIVLANYQHETIFYGNLFPEGSDSLFDISRLTADAVVPRLQGSANLLTYNTSGSGGGATPAEIADEIMARLGVTAIPVNTVKIKGQTIIGTGVEDDPWRPEP